MSHKWKDKYISKFFEYINFCWGLMPQSSMVNLRGAHRPSISYRPIRPSDLEVVEKLHGDLFPIRYESEFFLNVVSGRDIVSWGAVDRNRPNGQSDELIGFITARIVMAKESEIEDMLRFETARADQTLVYILTLGVVESYRNLGIDIQMCQAVYLHVISYNNSAIHLYKKMSFQCVRRLHAFYFINGQHYDSYLFIFYVNDGRSPCSPLLNSANGAMETMLRELIMILVAYVRSGFKSAVSRLWRKKERKVPRWLKCKESGCGGGLLPMTQNKRIVVTIEVSGCEFV